MLKIDLKSVANGLQLAAINNYLIIRKYALYFAVTNRMSIDIFYI